jgi:hypothetical protein
MLLGPLLVVVTVVLALRHVCCTYASDRSKCLVGGLVAASVLAPYLWPSFLPSVILFILASPFLQIAIGVYVIFHQTIWCPEEERPKASRMLQRANPSDNSGVADL